MAFNNINPQVIFDALLNALKADDALCSANLLGMNAKIYLRRSPIDAVCPYLTIEGKECFFNGNYQFKTEYRVHCYTKMLSNGQIPKLGDEIIYRCQEILNDKQLDVDGMSSLPLTTSVIPSFFDPDSDKAKAHGVLRVFIECGY